MTDDANAPTMPEVPVSGVSGVKMPDSRFVLRRLLGRGGMGEVWLAHDTRVDREIAVKLMRGGENDRRHVARFLREARVQGRLEHPCVVPVHDLGGDDGGTPFFAMKRLAGTTLLDVLTSRDEAAWPRRTLLTRFVDICLAIELAHQRGVIHRDIKPANIMLGDFGEAYVLDWGLARLVGDSETTVGLSPSQGDEPGQTEAGALLGTPGYMAPEQVRGERVDGRADVYALGCILFEIVAGEPANPHASAIESTLAAKAHRPSARRTDVAPELDAICAEATAAELADRLPTARALADRVQRYLDGDRDLARRRELAAVHVANAQKLAGGTEDEHVGAIREAGRAIALDVENTEAQQILARLLLEPPAKIPDDAKRAMDSQRRVAEIAVLKSALLSYATFLIGLPLVAMLGVSSLWPVGVFAGCIVLNMVLCGAGLLRKQAISLPHAIAILVAHCGTLALVGILLGPLLLVPVLIFGSAAVLFTQSVQRRPKTIAFAHIAALAIPLALELLGITPSTFAIESGALVLRPWAIDLSPNAMIAALLGTTILQLFGNMIILDRYRGTQEDAEQRIYMQAWQLRQLVPRSGPRG